jgi:hypothetical protein
MHAMLCFIRGEKSEEVQRCRSIVRCIFVPSHNPEVAERQQGLFVNLFELGDDRCMCVCDILLSRVILASRLHRQCITSSLRRNVRHAAANYCHRHRVGRDETRMALESGSRLNR